MNALARYLSGADAEPNPGLPRLVATLMHWEIAELVARCGRLPRAAERAAAALLAPVQLELARLDAGWLARRMRSELCIDIDSDSVLAVLEVLSGERAPRAFPASLDRLGAVIAEELRLPGACRAARDATARWAGTGALLRALAPAFGDDAVDVVEPPRMPDAEVLVQKLDNDDSSAAHRGTTSRRSAPHAAPDRQPEAPRLPDGCAPGGRGTLRARAARGPRDGGFVPSACGGAPPDGH